MKSKVSIPLKSASLLLLRPSTKLSLYNYQILVLQRKQQLSFGSGLIFPGGKLQPQIDLSYKKTYGYNNILEATAIRQCFQQTGLYFTKKPILNQEILDKLSEIRLEYIKDVLKTNKTQQKQKYLLKLSTLLPPTSNLIPFLRLITIPQLKRRYDTTFYVLPIQQYTYINFMKYIQHDKYLHSLSNLLHSSDQFNNYRWMDPIEILYQHFNRISVIHPPQFIMVNIMRKYYKMEEFCKYLKGFNDDRNVNLGPNIVSLIKNNSYKDKDGYQYSATLIGDRQFPYDRIINQQQCQNLKAQMIDWQRWNRDNFDGKNRFLFTRNKEFFMTEYQVQSNIGNSCIKDMSGWGQIKKFIQQNRIGIK